MTQRIEILCVGNELLIGKTLNTNARWLAKRITTLGLKVNRVTVIEDDTEEISKALKEIFRREPRFIITTGGLGPTFDDKTLAGIASALGQELEANPEVLRMLEEKYREYAEKGGLKGKVKLTESRIKMARLPREAHPLRNPVGSAPGVLMNHGKITIIALPGVPSEMEAIFDESIVPMLKRVAGNASFYEATIGVDGVAEPDLAPLIDRTMHDNPYVYIKSHPSRKEEGKPHIELHLSTTASDSATAKSRVGKALIQIGELVRAEGGKTSSSMQKKPKKQS